MTDSDSRFPNRLMGILAIVAGVFVVLGGGCAVLFGAFLGDVTFVGGLGVLVGIGMIVAGVGMLRDNNGKSE